MARIVKSISISPRTADLIEKCDFNNFSGFVRECVLRYAETKLEMGCIYPKNPKRLERLHRCNPFAQDLCWSCWPFGRPERDVFFSACGRVEPDGVNLDEVLHSLDEDTHERNAFRLITFDDIEKAASKREKTPRQTKKRSLWRRLFG